jgi:hypothetical protein
MTTDQIILFALFGLVFAFLLWGKFRYDIVAFSALMAGVLLGWCWWYRPGWSGRGPCS